MQKGTILVLLTTVLSFQLYGFNNERIPLGYTSHQIIKTKILGGDINLNNDMLLLMADADELLDNPLLSVLDDKSSPKGVNPNDYVSYAPYWWPNPETDDGLPHVRRDGEINKNLRSKGDDKRFTKMAISVHILSLAYFYSDQEKYAEKATDFITKWFLDSTYLMNPNVNSGQIIPGKKDFGRRAGINEMRFLANVIDGVYLISNSQAWSITKDLSLKEWFTEYLYWLRNSEHGKEEEIRPNNHGTWYDVQVVSIAIYLGKKELATDWIENKSKPRIESQISEIGMQALEVSRGFSLHYSIYNIKAFFALATLSERLNIDLWNYKSKNGASLQKAIDYLIPYVNNQEEWPHNDKGRGQEKNWPVVLAQAVRNYQLKKYSLALEKAFNSEFEYCQYCTDLIIP